MKKDRTQLLRYNQFINLVNLIPDNYLFKVTQDDSELYHVTRKKNECLYLIKSLEKSKDSVHRIQNLRKRSRSLLFIQDMLYQKEVEKLREDIFYQLFIESEDDLQKQLKIVSSLTKQYKLNKKRVDYIFIYPELKKEIDDVKSIISLDTSSFEYCQFDDIQTKMNHIFKYYPEKSLYHEVISFFNYQSVTYEKVAKRNQYSLIIAEKEKVKVAYEMGGFYQGKFIDFDMTFCDDFLPFIFWLENFKKETLSFLELIEEKEFDPEAHLLDYVEEICIDSDKYYIVGKDGDLISACDLSDYINNLLDKQLETDKSFQDEVVNSLSDSFGSFYGMFQKQKQEVQFIGNYENFNQIIDWLHGY